MAQSSHLSQSPALPGASPDPCTELFEISSALAVVANVLAGHGNYGLERIVHSLASDTHRIAEEVDNAGMKGVA